MNDIFDTLTPNTATLDIFDELEPSAEGDIFDQITPSKSKVSTLGIIKKSLQQAPMSAAQSIGGIARAVGDITGIESVKQYGEDVYKGAEIELERERPEMETSLQKGIYGATQSIAQNMPGLALSAVTGSPIPALLAAGTLSGGREYGEAREAGVEPIKAGAGATGTAISEVATEYIPLGYLLKPGLSLAKRMLFSTISELVGENINTVAQKAIQWWERNPDKTTGEFVAELYPDAKQTSLQVLLSSPVMALGGQALTKLTPTTKATTVEPITGETVTTPPKDIFDELQPETPPETLPPIKETIKTGTEAGESLISQEAAPVVSKETVEFYPDDVVLVKGNNGLKDFEASFRGYTGKGKAVVFDKKTGNQMTVESDSLSLVKSNKPVLSATQQELKSTADYLLQEAISKLKKQKRAIINENGIKEVLKDFSTVEGLSYYDVIKQAESEGLINLKDYPELQADVPGAPERNIYYSGGSDLESKTGIYFTPDKNLARSFAQGKGAFRENIHGKFDTSKKSFELIKAQLELKNPKKVLKEGLKEAETQNLTQEKIETLKKLGYDSMISYANGEIYEVVIFDKAQIKILDKSQTQAEDITEADMMEADIQGQQKMFNPKGEIEAAPVVSKEPWQMTRDEILSNGYVGFDIKSKKYVFRKSPKKSDNNHLAAVHQALSEGKQVPPEVLKDYPELQADVPGAQTEHPIEAAPVVSKEPAAKLLGEKSKPSNMTELEKSMWEKATQNIPASIVNYIDIKSFNAGKGGISNEPETEGFTRTGEIIINGSNPQTLLHEIAHRIDMTDFGDRLGNIRRKLRNSVVLKDISPRERVANFIEGYFSEKNSRPYDFVRENFPDLVLEFEKHIEESITGFPRELQAAVPFTKQFKGNVNFQKVKDIYETQEPKIGDTFVSAGGKEWTVTDIKKADTKGGLKKPATEIEISFKGGKSKTLVYTEKIWDKLPKGEIVKEPSKVTGEVKAGSLAFGMDLPKYTSSINLNNWDTTYDVKKLTSDIVEKSGIQKTKKTFEQIRQEAEEIGMTEKQLVKNKNIPIDKMAAEITAMRDIAVNTVQQTRYVMDEALKIATDETKSQDIRDEALTVALLKMSKAGTVLKQVSGTSSEIGRALSAHRMKVGAYKATKNYKAMLDALGGREVGIEILKKFAGIDPNDTKATVQFIRDVQQAKTMDMVYEAWRNAILSSPKTILTNAISNTVTMMTKPIETLTAASLEAGKQLVTGKPRKVFFGEVKAETLGIIQGIKDGFRVGLQSFVTELPSDTETKIEMAKGTAIPGKTGRVIRYPQRLLMATDEMFKAMMYRSELNALAYRKASLEGKRGQERIDAMAEYLINPTEEMISKSRNESLYRTYNKPLGKFGNQVMQLRESDPSGTLKYILPFIRTPVNIFKFGLERTPINFARLGYLISKGKIADDMAEELSKPLLGSAIGMGVAMLVAQGFITGGAPKDKEEKDALYRTGWQPYSFKIGDMYIPYNRIEPMGSIVGSVADYVELFKDSKPKEIDEMAGRIATSIAKNWTNKTFLLGLSNAINAIQDPERYGENLIQSFAGSLIPNILATTAKATDETLRQPRTVLEAMKTRIPYLDRSVLPRQDIWGRDIQKFGKGIIGKVSRGMSPVVISEVSKDLVDIEMVRLLQSVDLAISLPQEKIQGIKLPPELHREYVQKSGELAYKLINSAIATPEYQKLQDDEIKYKVIRNTIDRARDAYKPVIINKIFETPKYKHLIPKKLNLK